jgi:alpha-L-arabinofuranosidase
VLITWLERNADLAIMAAYAPLLVNVNPGARNVAADLIGYDAVGSFGSPSYYAQRMFMTHRGDRVLPAVIRGSQEPPSLFATASRVSSTGEIILKAINTAGEARPLQIELTGAGSIDPHAHVEVLSGRPSDANSTAQPEKVVPRTQEITNAARKFSYNMAAYSINVMVLKADYATR